MKEVHVTTAQEAQRGMSVVIVLVHVIIAGVKRPTVKNVRVRGVLMV